MEYPQAQQTPPPAAPAKKFPWVAVIIGVVVVCLLCVVVVLVAGIGKKILDGQNLLGGETPGVTTVVVEAATATPVPDRFDPTATAEEPAAEPTAEEAPAADATATPPTEDGETGGAGSGLVIEDGLLQDDFSTDEAGWPTAKDANIDLGVRDGAYYFQILTPDYYDWAYFPVDFNPQQVSFDVTNLQDPPDGNFGLFCQFQDSNNYLYLEVTVSDGFILAQMRDGKMNLLSITGDADNIWTYTRTLNRDVGDTNHFDVVCKPDEMVLSINGELVKKVTVEEPFAYEGESAFFVFAVEEADADGFAVNFDNVTVWREPQQ